MGKKKKIKRREFQLKPWCWYCDRTFVDEKTLVQHQKSRHLTCARCYRRMVTAGGLKLHARQVHNEDLMRIPNALPGRDTFEYEIIGMEGVPELDLMSYEHKQRNLSGFDEYETQSVPRPIQFPFIPPIFPMTEIPLPGPPSNPPQPPTLPPPPPLPPPPMEPMKPNPPLPNESSFPQTQTQQPLKGVLVFNSDEYSMEELRAKLSRYAVFSETKAEDPLVKAQREREAEYQKQLQQQALQQQFLEHKAQQEKNKGQTTNTVPSSNVLQPPLSNPSFPQMPFPFQSFPIPFPQGQQTAPMTQSNPSMGVLPFPFPFPFPQAPPRPQ